MSQWDDAFNKHAVHSTLANIRDLTESPKLPIDNQQALELIEKIKVAATYTEVSLQNALKPLVSANTLNQCNKLLTNILNHLNEFSANQNVANLQNTSNHIDSLMGLVLGLPIPHQHLEQDTYNILLQDYKKLVESAYLQLENHSESLEEQFNTLTERGNEQSLRLDQLKGSIEEQKQKIEAQIQDFSGRFSKLQKDREDQLESILDEYRDQFSALIDKHIDLHKKALAKLSEESDKVIEDLKDKQESASNLVQIIGNIGITGNYQKIANEEKQQADKWRNIALGFMVTMVVIIAGIIFHATSNNIDWIAMLFRLAAALVLSIPAGYAARESSRHRNNENHNRRAELELASLDPFLEKLPEDQRNEIKKNLTERFFGLDRAPQQEESISKNDLLGLIKSFIPKN